ncbi:MAG TPA: hypothetical protein VFI03_09805 [Solirubrobacterales bacterium]|nr:hypothetical protein [Solirubrobacterales bacterium]
MQMMARESWTDERLDDLNVKVTRGFEQVDKRFEQVDEEFKAVRAEMKEGFDKVEARFDAMNGRFDSLHRVILTSVIALFGAMFTGFATLAGILATKL